MKQFVKLIVIISLVLAGGAAPGLVSDMDAEAAVFNMGPGSTIDTSGTNTVLSLNVVNMNPDLDNIIFDLAAGESETFYFATIGTSESWINSDDVQPGAVTAIIDFESPSVSRSIGGTSVGFSALWQFVQGWNLEWDDPVRIILDSGLDFSIGLNDVGYLSWLWQGPDGTADLYATVTLNAVPLPAPLLLFASGLIGLLGLRRKFSF